MPVIDLRNFQGEVPKNGPSALTATQAQRASNARLVSSELRALKQPVKIFQPANQPVSIYRLSNGAQSAWLTYTRDTDTVPGPIADVTDFRVYITDGVNPRKTNWNMATNNGTNVVGPFPIATYPLGIPNPTVAMGLAAAGTGSGTAVTRAYVYTWLQTFGTLVEESGPSPAASVNWQTGQTINISGLPTAGPAGCNVTAKRIYRTVVGTTSTLFEWVADVPIAVATVNDNLSDAAIPGLPLPSLTWVPPPAGLQGLINIGNGVLAGFVGNQLYFSDPYHPQAWPVQYTLTFPANIVGLGMAGANLIVCTDQYPWMITGTAPGSMSQTPITIYEPCVSKRSVVSDLAGMLYASPNGLVGISALIQGVVTDQLIEREAWQGYNPTTMQGAVYDGRYVGFYTLNPDIPMPDGAATDLGGRALIIDKADAPVRVLYTHMDVASFALAPPLSFMNFYAAAAYADKTGKLFAVSVADNAIYQIDGDLVNFMTADWKSKRFIFPSPINMAVVQADADYNNPATAALAAKQAAITAANTAIFNSGITKGYIGEQMFGDFMIGGSLMTPPVELADQQTFQVLIYADGKLIATYSPQSQEPMRLPSGFRSQVWEIEIVANYSVRSVQLATSIKELRDASAQAESGAATGG